MIIKILKKKMIKIIYLNGELLKTLSYAKATMILSPAKNYYLLIWMIQ